jgi:hypothetical protein
MPHVIMTALQKDSFAIAEADMMDASQRTSGTNGPRR